MTHLFEFLIRSPFVCILLLKTNLTPPVVPSKIKKEYISFSHRTFRKSGHNPITIPTHEPIKRVYIIMVRAVMQDDVEIPVPVDALDLSDYSGQFKLRIPKTLHRSLSVHAKEEGISMNQYCLYLLSMNDAVHSQS